MEASQTSTSRLAFESLLVFASVFAIYVSLPTQNYYWDGLIYGEFLEQVEGFGIGLFHPNHLVYNFAGYLTYRVLAAVHVVDRALFALQYLSIAFGSAAVAMFYLICRRIFESAYLCLTVTGLLAFAAAWWRYSTDANVYVISIFFLLLSFYLLIVDRPKIIASSLAFVAAMLFHELAALFLPVACLAIWQRSANDSRMRDLMKFVLTSSGLIVAAYVAAFVALNRDFGPAEFMNWLTSYAGAATFGPNPLSAFAWLFKGTRQLFVDGSTNLLQRGPVSLIALTAFGFGVVALLISAVVFRTRLYAAISESRNANRRPLWLCVAWVIPYIGFLLLFEPQNTFYRLFYLPPLILAIGVALSMARRATETHYVRALLVLVFALYNFAFYIYPNSQTRPDSLMALSHSVERIWKGDTLVVFDPKRPTEGVIRTVKYFNRTAEWQDVGTLTEQTIRTEFAERYARHGTVWFERTAFEQASSDAKHGDLMSKVMMIDANSTVSASKDNLEFIKLVPRGMNDSTK